mmetsp:Transcript_2831/g.6886  ORF Transcript_2831/g.6886 Transcript_2831/m.6886 type:complete len:209 (+) Transcript_2831:649-1275(+)
MVALLSSNPRRSSLASARRDAASLVLSRTFINSASNASRLVSKILCSASTAFTAAVSSALLMSRNLSASTSWVRLSSPSAETSIFAFSSVSPAPRRTLSASHMGECAPSALRRRVRAEAAACTARHRSTAWRVAAATSGVAVDPAPALVPVESATASGAPPTVTLSPPPLPPMIGCVVLSWRPSANEDPSTLPPAAASATAPTDTNEA